MASYNRTAALDLARRIGGFMEEAWPSPEWYEFGAVPEEHVDVISKAITGVVAEILQSWLDAGSEREVTLEELYEPIEKHIRGWIVPEEEYRALKAEED